MGTIKTNSIGLLIAMGGVVEILNITFSQAAAVGAAPSVETSPVVTRVSAILCAGVSAWLLILCSRRSVLAVAWTVKL